MDSLRFWKLDDGGSVMERDGKPVSFSKEFARVMVKNAEMQFLTEQSNEIAVHFIDGLPPADPSPLRGASMPSRQPVPDMAQGVEWAFEIPIRFCERPVQLPGRCGADSR